MHRIINEISYIAMIEVAGGILLALVTLAILGLILVILAEAAK